MNKLFFWSLTSALAGFLFGFDTVVISGAEKEIQSLWDLSGWMHGLATSAALWGTVLGSLFGGIPTERFGRKRTLLTIGMLYLVSAIWSALAGDVNSFIIARLIGGIGVGISTVAAPLYISEISPPGSRGKLAGMFQFNIVFGILIAFLSNSLLSGIGENSWRWMLGVEAVPAIIYTILCFSLPESPRWLIAHKKDREGGLKVMRLLQPKASEAELEETVGQIENAVGKEDKISGFWSKRLSVPISLAILIAVFNQLSGINVILYFAPRLLGLAGVQDGLTAAVLIGVVNLIFTFVGLYLIDKLGRKTLLTIGSFGYIASLGVCAWAFLSQPAFTVISKAIDVTDTAAKVEKLEAGEHPMKPADETKLREKYLAAKEALVAAKAVTFPVDAGAVEVGKLAEEAKAKAADDVGGGSTLVLVCLLGFIAAHAVGQGAVIWVFISEIFPNRFRARGQSLGSFTHWFFAAGLTYLFPIAIGKFDAGYIFLFFCLMMVLQLIWVALKVPETKGIPLEELEEKLMR